MKTASMDTMMHSNPHSMADEPGKHADHSAMEKLMARAVPTHVAVKSGAWSDPGTWKNGRVPGDKAKVLIDEGLTVTYDQVSDARIETVVNKGNLKFSTNKDTQLIVETIFNGADGKLDIGSQQQSVAANKKAKIIFTSDRAINTNIDPTQLGKGLVSHGEVNIYGADKLDKVALVGDATAGNNTLTFKQNLDGWQVGDQVVLGGTGYGWNGNDEDNSRLQDEVLTITEINGRKVSFTNNDINGANNDVLRFDHTRSELAGSNDINLYAANLTRNVSFETENGKDVPISHRAHVMLMHNPKVNVLNAGFYELGRSDKSKLVDDIGKNIDGSTGNGTNIRGRYMLHLHLTGVDDPNGPASLLKGNALVGGPGWGIVQHESKADVTENVVFDVVGAGIVAESGNETGSWTDNMVIKTTGIGWQTAGNQRDNRKKKFDLGFDGDGYWIQGAGLIENKNNKAISSNRAGMVLFGSTLNQDYDRPIKTIPVKNLPKDLQQLFTEGQTEVDIRDIPFSTVKGFESYNATVGLRVWAHGTNFDGEGDFSSRPVGYRTEGQEPDTAHKGRSRVEDFKLWGNRYSGAEVFYSSNIDLKDGLVLGRDGEDVSGGRGLFNNHAAFNSTFDNITVAGYRQGAEVESPNSDKDFNATTIKNSRFRNNTYNLGAYGDEAPMQDSDRTRPDDVASYLKLQNNQFLDKASGNRAPVARFSVKSLGGLSVELNASASYDSDPLLPQDGKGRAIPNKGIAAYAWDLNGDGKFDRFGRQLKHSFDKAGSREVSLTVLDTQGESKTIANTVAVQPTAYRNAFPDGNFDDGTPTQADWKSSSKWADDGWFVSDSARIGGGVARLSQPGDWGEFIGRVITDEKVRKGQQKFSFRLKNQEGAPDKNYWDKNEVALKLWGVNGPFENNPYEQTGPEQIGTLGMQRTALVDENFGGEGGEFFDWKNFSFDVDLGKGYDHLLFQVNTTRTKNAGDYVAIDNVALTGAPNSVSGGVPTLGGTSSPTRPQQPVTPPVTPPVAPAPIDPPPATAPPTTPPITPPITPPTTPTPPTVPAPTGNYAKPVVTLSFEEAIDKLAKDTSTEGGNNSGRYRGGLSPAKGKVGQAAALDGRRDVIALKNSKDINLAITPERTVSMWFQAEDVTANKKQVIYEEGGTARGLNIYLEDNLLHFGGWNKAQSKWSGSWIKSNKVTSGKWHHLALVLDGESAVTDNAMTAYLDGQDVGQMEGSQLWSRSGGIGIGNVNKGTRFESGATKGTRNYGLEGAVDEFNLYNSALESSEVKQLASGFM